MWCSRATGAPSACRCRSCSTSPRRTSSSQPGDVVTLVHDPLTFTAMGATGRSGVAPFETIGLTLEEALGHAGGLLDDRADPAGLFVVRYEPQTVPETMGEAGVIFDTKDMSTVAALLAYLMRRPDVGRRLIAGQYRRVMDFLPGLMAARWHGHLVELIKKC